MTNIGCSFIFHQPKLPESVKQLRKFWFPACMQKTPNVWL